MQHDVAMARYQGREMGYLPWMAADSPSPQDCVETKRASLILSSLLSLKPCHPLPGLTVAYKVCTDSNLSSILL